MSKKDKNQEIPPQQEPQPEPEETVSVDANLLLEALQAKQQTLEQELEQTKDRLLRTAAEYENFRKRSAREQETSFANGVSHSVMGILQVLDTLEMAAAAPCSDENYKKGVCMTLEKAAAVLAGLNITEIEAQDMPFDPELHSAVLQQPAAEGQQSGVVAQVFQKGYKMGERVIRHASVIVTE